MARRPEGSGAMARLALAQPDLLVTDALIGNRRVGENERLAVIDPPSGETLASVTSVGAEGARLAVDDLVRLMAAEQGKPLEEARAAALVVGDGRNADTQLGPLIDARTVAKADRYVADALAAGARVLAVGSTRRRAAACIPLPGSPTWLAIVLNREKTFGRVEGLIVFETEDEAIAIANDTAAGLAPYVYTQDSDCMVEALEYGMVGINTGLISIELAPCGGIKEAKLGRVGSHLGIDEYSETEMVCRQSASIPAS